MDTPLSQQEAKTWKKPGEKTPTRSPAKNTFWDCKDFLLVHMILQSMVHSTQHSFIWEKLRGDVVLLHDNTPVLKSEELFPCRNFESLGCDYFSRSDMTDELLAELNTLNKYGNCCSQIFLRMSCTNIPWTT